MQANKIYCKNGDIYMADLPDDEKGSLQSGIRPVVVVSNDKANQYSPVITILPMTSNLAKRRLPTHVTIEACGLGTKSLVLAEQITTINKTNLRRRIGSIKATAYETELRRAMAIQLDL